MPFPILNTPTMRPFPAGSESYEPTIAWWLAQCSELSYQHKSAITQALQNAGFSAVDFFEFRGTFGYLAQHPGINLNGDGGPFAVLIFRGTRNDYMNILTDVIFMKRPIPDENLRAHGGFVTALQDVWGVQSAIPQIPQITVRTRGSEGVSSALDALPPALPCYFAGHSLGGALATLAAQKRHPRALYTFGSPRVGGRDFAVNMSQQRISSYRVANYIDLITRLPLPFKFRHIDSLVYLAGNGKVLRSPNKRDRFVKLLVLYCPP